MFPNLGFVCSLVVKSHIDLLSFRFEELGLFLVSKCCKQLFSSFFILNRFVLVLIIKRTLYFRHFDNIIFVFQLYAFNQNSIYFTLSFCSLIYNPFSILLLFLLNRVLFLFQVFKLIHFRSENTEILTFIASFRRIEDFGRGIVVNKANFCKTFL